MVRPLVLALFACLAGPAHAAEQSFNVFLGGQQLGWLRYSGGAGSAQVTSLFDNTPLGVFNGTYEGRSKERSGRVVYHGKSVSKNKNREVEIIRKTWKKMSDDGRAFALSGKLKLPEPLVPLISKAIGG